VCEGGRTVHLGIIFWEVGVVLERMKRRCEEVRWSEVRRRRGGAKTIDRQLRSSKAIVFTVYSLQYTVLYYANN
jgi:hypothetical protein